MPRLTENITIRIEGSAFGDLYPAEKVAKLLLQLDRVVKASTEMAIEEHDGYKPKLEVYAGYPTRGSFLQLLQIAWNASDDMAKLATPLMPLAPQMLSLLNDAIEFIKASLPLFGSDTQPTFSVPDNNGNVTINNGDTHYHARTIIIAGAITGPVLAIMEQLGDGVESVSLGGPSGSAVVINQEDHAIVSQPHIKSAAKALSRAADKLSQGNRTANVEPDQVVDVEPVEAVVDILSFDKVLRSGKLRVVSSGTLKTGKYGFDLAQRPETDSAIRAMLQSRVRVSCRVHGGRKLELLRVEAALN